MVFFNKYLKPLNKPIQTILIPFEAGVDFFTKPRFLRSQKPETNLSRDELKEISELQRTEEDIPQLTQIRLFEVEESLVNDFGLKPRIALEYEFSIRDSEQKPINLNTKEQKELTKILKEELPSFQEMKNGFGAMHEFKFDTGVEHNLRQVLRDIEKLKENFSDYLDKVSEKLDTKRKNLSIDDRPYQPDTGKNGCFFTNTGKFHVNLSLIDEDGENVFASKRKLLDEIAAYTLKLQLPNLALSTSQEGLERLKKGSSCSDLIKLGENMATGGSSKFAKLAASLMTSAASLGIFALADSGAWMDIPEMFFAGSGTFLTTLLAFRPSIGANASLSIRSSSNNPFKSLLQKCGKRPAKSKEATRIENRIHGGDQDPALVILNTVYPALKVLKGDSETKPIPKIQKIPSKPEELLNHSIASGYELSEMYGDELHDALFAKAVKEYLA